MMTEISPLQSSSPALSALASGLVAEPPETWGALSRASFPAGSSARPESDEEVTPSAKSTPATAAIEPTAVQNRVQLMRRVQLSFPGMSGSLCSPEVGATHDDQY